LKKLPAFYATRKFINVVAKVRNGISDLNITSDMSCVTFRFVAFLTTLFQLQRMAWVDDSECRPCRQGFGPNDCWPVSLEA